MDNIIINDDNEMKNYYYLFFKEQDCSSTRQITNRCV